MKILSLYLFLLLGFFSTANTPAYANPLKKNEIIFGSVAMDTPAMMHRRLSPLTEFLSNTLGLPVSLKLSSNMKQAIKDVNDGSVHLAYLTPVAYLRTHEQSNSRLIVKTLTQNKGWFQLMIVVRKDSPIQNIEDLVGKSFAFGDPAALLQRAAVVGAGVPLERLSKQEFLGHYDNIARAVRRGFYDAGILKDTTALKWKNEGLRVIYTSPELPPYNITANEKLSPELFNKIRNAFLQLDPNDPKDHIVIKALDNNYTGFAATNDAEYDIVRELIKPF